MANANEIKTRIQSVQDTAKITNAMYLISSTKMQRAKRSLENTRPYYESLLHEIERVFASADDPESKYFYDPDKKNPDNKVACLVITADRGLAGSYNMNVIKEAERMFREHPKTKFFVVGDYGRHYFDRHGIPYVKSFDYTANVPHIREARDISDVLLDSYDSGEINMVYVIYTVMKTAITSEVDTIRFLPFDRGDFMSSEEKLKKELGRFEFFPSYKEVLDNALRSIETGFVYSTLVYSFCAEQNARMGAMDSANKNAEKLLAELRLQFNRARQAGITQEITEIAAGELAQKRKRIKKQNEEVETS
ncbi:MAG: ATP synthase F1 subunit gamma [Lachnospiraceae bacterium]|nr:ATP synthase F1 subunit gamma [Lachnospiraceae bacterium]